MDKLAEIFERQAHYVKALVPTYLANGFQAHAEPMPWPLDSRHAQEEFRLLAWRFTEEVMEAIETYENNPRSKKGIQDYTEEVSDALHFFVELCIASGITREVLLTGNAELPWLPVEGDSFDQYFAMTSKLKFNRINPWASVIRSTGLAMMELRQRPWRTDSRPTNRARWLLGMHLIFRDFVGACIVTYISAEDLHRAYFQKAKTNDQRIKDFGVI